MRKNINIKTLDTNLLRFFRLWMEFLKPFHKLTNKEIEIVAFLLYKRHLLKAKIPDDKYVDKLLLGEDVRNEIKKLMNYNSNQVLSNMISELRSKKIIVDNKITKVLIPNIETDAVNFKLVLNFNIDEAR